MSNLYALHASAQELAAHFGLAGEIPEIPREVTRATQGLVIRETKAGRVANVMNWGFPRPPVDHDLFTKTDLKAVNLVANLTSPMWDVMVQDTRYRCLIPVSEFANPDGEPGHKTRSWFKVADKPLFAWAGFCRNTREWGAVFAGLTTDALSIIHPTNDRMPVMLRPAEYERWLHGPIADVIGFQFRKYPPGYLEKRTTDERWVVKDYGPQADLFEDKGR